jgi:hypothetical protein
MIMNLIMNQTGPKKYCPNPTQHAHQVGRAKKNGPIQTPHSPALDLTQLANDVITAIEVQKMPKRKKNSVKYQSH